MNDLLNEQLSALVDGELPPEETALLLKRLEREPDLKQRLARYALAGDVLRGERLKAGPQLAMRVAQALAGEPAHVPGAIERAAVPVAADAGLGDRPAASLRRAPASTRRWLGPLAGLAVAATVAGLTVFVLQRGAGEPGAAPVAANAARDTARELARDSGSVEPPPPLLARAARAPSAPGLAVGGSEPASYVTPAQRPQVGAIPPGELVNYVVAHVQFITPIGRGSVITGLVADDAPVEPAAR